MHFFNNRLPICWVKYLYREAHRRVLWHFKDWRLWQTKKMLLMMMMVYKKKLSFLFLTSYTNYTYTPAYSTLLFDTFYLHFHYVYTALCLTFFDQCFKTWDTSLSHLLLPFISINLLSCFTFAVYMDENWNLFDVTTRKANKSVKKSFPL